MFNLEKHGLKKSEPTERSTRYCKFSVLFRGREPDTPCKRQECGSGLSVSMLLYVAATSGKIV